MLIKKPSKTEGKILVIFQLPSSIWAEKVNLAGDFNDWDREMHPMTRSGNGNWTLTLELDADKQYEFRYLVNGDTWHNDWHADNYVSNPYGGDNSVVDTSILTEEN